jgi:hypothetical protein
MTTVHPQVEAKEILLELTELSGTSESNQHKTVETFLELLGARVRNHNGIKPYFVCSCILGVASLRLSI